MAENDLARAFTWLSWEVARERSTKPRISNKRDLMALVVRETFRIVDGDRDIVIQELAFQGYLESIGADAPTLMRQCLDRGWSEPRGADDKGRKLRIDETRLAKDAEEFADGGGAGGADPSEWSAWFNKSDWRKAWGQMPETTFRSWLKKFGETDSDNKQRCRFPISWLKKSEKLIPPTGA